MDISLEPKIHGKFTTKSVEVRFAQFPCRDGFNAHDVLANRDNLKDFARSVLLPKLLFLDFHDASPSFGAGVITLGGGRVLVKRNA